MPRLMSSCLRDRRKQLSHICIISKRLAEMRKPIHIPRPKHKTPSQLKRIPPKLVLLMSLGLRPFSRGRIVPPQQMKNIRRLQLQRVIRLFLLINQKWKRDTCLLSELSRILCVSKTHRSQRRPLRSKLLLMRAQLRDVFAAENSTVVPQENHYRRLRRPQRPQPHLFPIRVRQHNHRQPAA